MQNVSEMVEVKTPRELFDENEKLINFMIKKIPERLRKLVPYMDLYQEGSLTLWKCSQTYDSGISKFSTYYCTTARRSLYKYIHQNSTIIRPPCNGKWDSWRVISKILLFNGSIQFNSSDGTWEEEQEYENLCDLSKSIQECLKYLDPIDRECLILYYKEKFTQEDIGKKFNFSKERARQRIKRARKEIRNFLSQVEWV